MSVRRAGVVAALGSAGVLSVAGAMTGVLMGGLDPIEAVAMLLGLLVVLLPPATFTGWLCAPRLAGPGHNRLSACAMAALTASTSTAVLIWVVMLGGTLAVDVARGRLDPGSWTLAGLGGWVLFYGIATSIVWLASFLLTIPLAILWESLTLRLVGRDVAPRGH